MHIREHQKKVASLYQEYHKTESALSESTLQDEIDDMGVSKETQDIKASLEQQSVFLMNAIIEAGWLGYLTIDTLALAEDFS